MAANLTPPSPIQPQTIVHPAVQPVSYLLGTWKGKGEGGFPTISPFCYSEELQFSHSPSKPVIAYSSKTWKLSTGEPMHSESGFWRPKTDGTIEVVIAQSTGLVEVLKGTFDAELKSVKLKSSLVGNASKLYVYELCNTKARKRLAGEIQILAHPFSEGDNSSIRNS